MAAEIERHGVRALPLQLDQADATKAPQLIQSIIERFGRLDIVVNNASIDRFGAAGDAGRDDAVFEHYWAVANTGFRAVVRAASAAGGGRA